MNTRYASNEMKAWLESPEFAIRNWRSSEGREEFLDEFLFWLKYDFPGEPEPDKEKIAEITAWVDLFLERDMQKIRAGEMLLLKRWSHT